MISEAHEVIGLGFLVWPELRAFLPLGQASYHILSALTHFRDSQFSDLRVFKALFPSLDQRTRYGS